jgi:hypothetical protein
MHQRKCTEPVAPSSGFPTDRRRSGNHSENHQPWTLRARCSGDSMDRTATGQAPDEHHSTQIARRFARRITGLALAGPLSVRTRKCTEPVAPSSGFPTDRRRSDCRSESHQPRTLRTRCIAHSRESPRGRQGVASTTLRKLRYFLFTTATLRLAVCALAARREENGRTRGSGRKDSPSRERFRPPSRRTFRFRVVLLGGLRPTGAPCSAQEESRRSDLSPQGGSTTKVLAICERIGSRACATGPGQS